MIALVVVTAVINEIHQLHYERLAQILKIRLIRLGMENERYQQMIFTSGDDAVPMYIIVHMAATTFTTGVRSPSEFGVMTAEPTWRHNWALTG